jgi:hypothetical protein
MRRKNLHLSSHASTIPHLPATSCLLCCVLLPTSTADGVCADGAACLWAAPPTGSMPSASTPNIGHATEPNSIYDPQLPPPSTCHAWWWCCHCICMPESLNAPPSAAPLTHLPVTLAVPYAATPIIRFLGARCFSPNTCQCSWICCVDDMCARIHAAPPPSSIGVRRPQARCRLFTT